MEIDIARLKALAQAADHGPWRVITEEHPHYRGGAHIERRIFTAWDHPQLKGPLPIANTSIGIPEKEGDPARHMGCISEENAAYIAAANPAVVLELLEIIADRTTDVLALDEQVHHLRRDRDALVLERNALREALAAPGRLASMAAAMQPMPPFVLQVNKENEQALMDMLSKRPPVSMGMFVAGAEDADPDDELDDILPLAPRKPLVIRTREELEAAGHDAKKVDMMLMVQEHVLDIQRAAFPDFDAKPTHFAGLTGNAPMPANLPASLDLPDTSTVSGVLYNFSDAERYSLNDGRIVFAVENPVECSDFGHMIGSTVIINREMWLVKNVECFMHMPPWRKGERIGLQVEASLDLPDSEGGHHD